MPPNLTPLAISLIPDTAYTALVTADTRGSSLRQTLLELRPADLFTTPVVSAGEASAALSAIWLWHDALDASHVLSQAIETPTGSLWHAILHRREGDFSNAKYWYARARAHPSLKSLAPHIEQLLATAPANARVDRLVSPTGWNPDAFVDAVESVHDRPADPRHATLVAVQKLEWKSAFETTVRAALGL